MTPSSRRAGPGCLAPWPCCEELDWDRAVADGVAAVAALRDHPAVDGGVGVLGFCFGGGMAFNVAAVAEPKPDALVSYYGSALPNLLGSPPR